MGKAKLLLLLIAIAVGAWAWWRFAPDTLPAEVGDRLPRSPVANPVLYKWKDQVGQWHITDKPPENGDYEAVPIRPDTNVVPSYPAPEQQ